MSLYLACALFVAVAGTAWLVWEARHTPDVGDYLGVSEAEAARIFDGASDAGVESDVAREGMTPFTEGRTAPASGARADHGRRPRRLNTRSERVRARHPSQRARLSRRVHGARLVTRRQSRKTRTARVRQGGAARIPTGSPRR